MIIVVYSKIRAETIEQDFGRSEYSYHFVLEAFRPVLHQLGTVVTVLDPWSEVDVIYQDAVGRGEACVFLSFSPPHQTPLGLACPTIPVFAWEFDSIPSETWFGEREQDWRFVLDQLGRAITHSSHAVRTVQAAMGPDFPIVSIPAPVWDRFAALRPQPQKPSRRTFHLDSAVRVLDTRAIDVSAHSSRRCAEPLTGPPGGPGPPADVSLDVEGVVYTSVFSPYDNRKNIFDMLGGFCWTFRDVPDAILVIKLAHHDASQAIDVIMTELNKLWPFRCRVILVDGYLADADYTTLMTMTTFALNTSHGEGQCLPLMEYMSCGIPAVAPCHTGMRDYLRAGNAFLIQSTAEPTWWQHDPRSAIRTLRRRIDFESLVKAFRESYRVAKEVPGRYAELAAQARLALEEHCSSAVTVKRLREFLAMPPRPPQRDAVYGHVVPRDITYPLGRTVDFARSIDPRCYLISGWNDTELGHGVWSEGRTAELAFRHGPGARKRALLRANLTAFISSAHPDIAVQVAANGIPVAHWTFDVIHPEERDHAWREAVIPAKVVAMPEIHLTLRIDHPASPWELGLSDDRRHLGIMLHELSITPMERSATAGISMRSAAEGDERSTDTGSYVLSLSPTTVLDHSS